MSERAAEMSPQATAGPEHKRLEVFVGKWNQEGRAYDSPFGSAADISAVETFEWLTGGLFLVHRLEGQLGGVPIACIEIIGYDAASQNYSAHTFYNDGKENVWRLERRDGSWRLSGEWQQDGGRLLVRCTEVFSDSGDVISGKWEYSPDGTDWQTFWETTLTRA
jgi:uncharacterized protein DUF1579